MITQRVWPWLAGALWIAVPDAARAAQAPEPAPAPPAPTESFSEQRGYVYAAPGFFAAPIGDDDTTDIVDFSYQWGFGVGGFWAFGPARRLGISAGFAFEHIPANLDGDIDDTCEPPDIPIPDLDVEFDCSIHAFHLLPEIRVGGALDRFYGYGMLAPGLGIVHGELDPYLADEDTAVGFNLGLGLGAQYMVWRRLFLGGELGFDFGFYDDDAIEVSPHDIGVYTLDLEVLVGWYF